MKTPVLESLFNNFVNNFINNFTCAKFLWHSDILTQVFSYEFCKISKSIFFIEHLRMTASVFECKLKFLSLFLLKVLKWNDCFVLKVNPRGRQWCLSDNRAFNGARREDLAVHYPQLFISNSKWFLLVKLFKK